MALFTALAIGSGVASAASGILAAKAKNTAAKAGWRNALIDQSFQNRQNQRQFIEQDRAARQTGFEAALASRAAQASGRNSAVSGGVSGNTVDALISEQLRIGARNQSRIQDQRDNNAMNRSAQEEGIRSQTQGRLNSIEGGSFGLLDAAQIAMSTGLSIAGGNMAKGPKGKIPAG